MEPYILAAMFTLIFYAGYWIGHETEPRIPKKLRNEIETLVTIYVNGNSDMLHYIHPDMLHYIHPDRYTFVREEVISMLVIALQQIKEIEN